MMYFKSYLFIRDIQATEEYRSRKGEMYQYGIIFYLIAAIFASLEVTWGAIVSFIIATTLSTIGKFVLLRTRDKGIVPSNLIIEDNTITLLNIRFNIYELENLRLNLLNYEGGPSFSQYQNAQGDENEVMFTLEGKHLKYNFYIPSGWHYNELINYFQEKKLKYKAKEGLLWT
ncbi:hypothetical protein GCM10023188_11960 [Pontibacter saemangeumensis]|uniref:YcxB-like protein n=1 Tax=Pontibacter saemangeumensis TaxID=1084525 RepID=A0ABP8LEG3_9BACT